MNYLGKNFHNKTFRDEDFSNVSFDESSFSSCIFEKCDFTESSFLGLELWGCTFRRCNLSLVDVTNCKMENVIFEESKIIGVSFFSCNYSLLFSFSSSKSLFQYCDFSSLPMENTKFDECKIIECKFIEAYLRKSSFSLSDLDGTKFMGADLREVNFKKAYNYTIHPCENKLAKAQFSFPECLGLIKPLNVIVNYE